LPDFSHHECVTGQPGQFRTDVNSERAEPPASGWRSYSDVDAACDPALLSGQLDDIASVPFVAAEKQRSLELLDLAIGSSVLDVGCGNGSELGRLAKLVGARGRVVGLDCSTAMIKHAKARGLAGRGPIELLVGDARSLPFKDAEFDGCRAERTLQHVARPEVALAEIVRVTRSGGRVVVTEFRWGLVAPDLNREVTDQVLQLEVSDRDRQEWVGYRLQSMFQRAGLTDVQDVSHDSAVCEHDDLFRFTHLRSAADAAVRAGAITPAQASAWLERLSRLVKRGEACALVIILHVAGTKP
jgi:ubiquinone/menaquinone biosynthesis C-methylase UbiE